jgi:hypothetical protein
MSIVFKQRLTAYDPRIKNDLKSRAELGIFPSYLLADDIAELWYEGTEFSKEAYLRFIKEQIEDGQLPCMTIGQWIEAMDKKQKEPHKYARPPKVLPPQQGNAISFAESGSPLGLQLALRLCAARSCWRVSWRYFWNVSPRKRNGHPIVHGEQD